VRLRLARPDHPRKERRAPPLGDSKTLYPVARQIPRITNVTGTVIAYKIQKSGLTSICLEAEPWFEGGSPGAENNIPKMDEMAPAGMKTIPTMEIMRTLRLPQR